MDYSYHFPVVRGMQAHQEYYIAMVPLKMIGRLFPSDDEYVAPEYRAQRKLNQSRIPVMSRYITENRDTYVFSALAASIDAFNAKRWVCVEIPEMEGVRVLLNTDWERFGGKTPEGKDCFSCEGKHLTCDLEPFSGIVFRIEGN